MYATSGRRSGLPMRADLIFPDKAVAQGELAGGGQQIVIEWPTSDFAPGIRRDPLLEPFLGPRLELVNGKQLPARLIELTKR